MDLSQLKLGIEKQIAELAKVMDEIQRLDKYIMESENPDNAAMMVHVILEKGDLFEKKTEEVKTALQLYIAEQKKLGAPVDFSYTKLLNQIIKG